MKDLEICWRLGRVNATCFGNGRWRGGESWWGESHPHFSGDPTLAEQIPAAHVSSFNGSLRRRYSTAAASATEATSSLAASVFEIAF